MVNVLISKFDIIEKLKKGEKMDQVPVSLWKHFPIDDLRAEPLCKRHIELQRRYDLDLVKFSLSGGYMNVAFGAEIEYTNSTEGAATVTKYAVNDVQDWERLKEPSIQKGILAEMLNGMKLYSKAAKDIVPFIFTVFSPLTVAWKISGKRFLKDLRTEPEKLHCALEVVSKTTMEFCNAALDAGANGIFFSTQMASYDLLSLQEFKEFGSKYDIPILRSLEKKSYFNVLHIHGSNLMFDQLVSDYPAAAVNWHDRHTPPSLRQAFGKTGKVLVGGLNQTDTLTLGTPETVRKEVLDAISQTGGKRLILGPGCVVPLNAVEGNLEEVIKTARRST
jgi:uroporphyrinogen decarboxylase